MLFEELDCWDEIPEDSARWDPDAVESGSDAGMSAEQCRQKFFKLILHEKTQR